MKRAMMVIAVLAMGFMLGGQVMAKDITIVGTGSGASVLKAVGAIAVRLRKGR